MAYNKHNFVSGATLYASQLNDIDNGIVALEELLLQIKQKIDGGTVSDLTLAEINNMIVAYFEEKTVGGN